jgi:anti-sigma factor RsiW
MNPRLNPRDFEALSAYVDGALDARQHAALEARLKAEPALTQALRQLQSTRALLRRAPQRKAPRNFTLTRQMAGEHQRGFSYGFASAVATLLLVVVTAGDLLAGGQLFLPATAPEASMLLMSESAPAGEAPLDLAFPEEGIGGAVEEDAFDGMYAEEPET